MNFDYTDEQKAFRAEIAAFCEKEINPGAEQRDRDYAFSRELFERTGQALGIQGLNVSPDLGGRGLDGLSTAVALEQFGYSCDDSGLTFAICAHLLASSVPIAAFATDEQKAEWFPGMCDGSLVAANCMTEPNAGSDIGSVATAATREGDVWVINGAKALATNGPAADVVVVFAITDPGANLMGRLTPFILPADTPGLTLQPNYGTLGQRTTPLGEIHLENVKAPDSAILGGRAGIGMAVFNHAMNWERTCLFAAHAGTMRRLTEMAIKRARTRKQGGKPIGVHQAVSHKIADMKIRTDAGRLLAYKAAARLETARDVALDASIAKAFVGESWIKAAQDLMQIHGGAGYLEETGVERHLRDAMSATLYSGTAEIQRNIIAGWLGLPMD